MTNLYIFLAITGFISGGAAYALLTVGYKRTGQDFLTIALLGSGGACAWGLIWQGIKVLIT